jgi:hypothetical protein
MKYWSMPLISSKPKLSNDRGTAYSLLLKTRYSNEVLVHAPALSPGWLRRTGGVVESSSVVVALMLRSSVKRSANLSSSSRQFGTLLTREKWYGCEV